MRRHHQGVGQGGTAANPSLQKQYQLRSGRLALSQTKLVNPEQTFAKRFGYAVYNCYIESSPQTPRDRYFAGDPNSSDAPRQGRVGISEVSQLWANTL